VTEYRFQSAGLCGLAKRLGLRRGHKTITPAIEQASSEFYRGLLRGLFDTDGSVQGTQQQGVSVRLSQSDRSLLEAVQRMLLRLGVASTVYRRREAGASVLPDGRGGRKAYDTKEQFELVISKDNLPIFRDLVGFSDSAKASRLDAAMRHYRRAINRERFLATVLSVEGDGEEPVYDVQVPGINTFDGNGLHAHNCGEQPLPPHGSCLLGSINLTRFVRDPFTTQARFDYVTFGEVVRVFTRMLDNVVEINGLPLPEQRDEIRRKRRHGMGYLGLGSALAMLGLRYGSPEAVEFTEKVTMQMAIAGWEEALALSDEKGPAPILTEEFTVTSEMLAQRPEMEQDGFKIGDKVPGRVLHARYSRYMQRLAVVAPDLVRQLEERGARFTHHTSIAPTGTIALSIGNNVSNGIEPSFAHRYFRNVIKEGKKTKERSEVVSYELLAYRHLVNANASPDAERAEDRLPDAFVTAEDITPEQHVAMQAAAQKWVDSSISKTVNVPTDIPFERFKDLYLLAHEKGLKGCTTFRFNPAAFQGVLVKEKDLKETVYVFKTESGEVVRARGDELVEYDGETHTAANLFDALKEGTYGRYA
jgi:ribonucleoside-diphosphate reductase alpha chain